MSRVNSNIAGFVQFLHKHNVINFVIAAILSDKINEFVTEFIDGIVSPLINNDNEKKKLEDVVVSVSGYKFKVGRFILVLLKFVLIVYLVYALSKMLKKFI